MASVVARDGRIYSPPFSPSSRQVLVIDSEEGMSFRLDEVCGGAGYKWITAAAADNGNIYSPPHDAAAVLVISPGRKGSSVPASSYLIDENHGSVPGKWATATLAPNGKIYCTPYEADSVLVIDPELDVSFTIGQVVGGIQKCGAASIVGTRIFAPPLFGDSNVLVVDTTSDTTYYLDGLETEGCCTSVVAPNGKIYD